MHGESGFFNWEGKMTNKQLSDLILIYKQYTRAALRMIRRRGGPTAVQAQEIIEAYIDGYRRGELDRFINNRSGR
jgi:hypothetical protein